VTALEERPVTERPGTRPQERVRLVEQLRVAVIFESRQHDLVLPADTPVAAVVESVLQVLNSGPRERDDDGYINPGAVTLTRVNGQPFERGQSLAAQSVKDGDLLILQVADAEVTLTPVIENASSAIAKILASTRSEVTEAVAERFAAVAAAVAVLAAVGLAVSAWRMNLAAGKDWQWWPAAALATLAVVLLAGGSLVWWRRRERAVADALWLSALIAAPAAAVIATPGRPGAWHAVFGLVTMGVLAAVLWRLTPAARGLLAWVTVTAAGLALLALMRAVFGTQMFYLWVAALAVALMVLKKSETIAGRMAHVPVPPFPTITGKFVFDDADDIAAEALAAAEHQGTPSVAELTRAAHAANTYLSALVAATAVFFTLGAWGALAMPGHGRWWLSTGYVLIIAAILVLGGRAFADRLQAIIVVATALVMTALVVIRYAVWWHSPTMCLAAGAAILTLGLLGLVIAAVVPRHVFSPLFRKLIEWTEYVLIVLVPPAAVWLLNLYYLARNR
jgi:type VII secretion integral membrane protein EccD